MMTIERHAITSREQWLALRRPDLTASDVGAVAGVDPRRTALRVYAEKSGQIAADDFDNNILRRGRWLEVAVIEALRERHPDWDIRRAGVYLRDPDIRLGATPDSVAIDPARDGIGNIQLKVVSRPIFDADWQDSAPLYYQLQSVTEAMLEGAAWNAIAALVIDTYSAELVEFDVPRHAAAEEKVRQIARRFWRRIETGERPAPDYERDGDVIGLLYPAEVPGKTVDLTADNRLPGLLARRARHKRMISLAESRVDAADAEIKDKLGDAEAATLPGWRITHRQQTRKEYVVKEKTFRTLRVTDQRQKEPIR